MFTLIQSVPPGMFLLGFSGSSHLDKFLSLSHSERREVGCWDLWNKISFHVALENLSLARRVARSCSACWGLGGDMLGRLPDRRQVFSVPGLGIFAQQKKSGIAFCPVPRWYLKGPTLGQKLGDLEGAAFVLILSLIISGHSPPYLSGWKWVTMISAENL